MKKLYALLILTLIFLFGNPNSTFSQSQKNLTIVVKDSQNNPVSGAVILFDNKRLKRWTNKRGEYKIKYDKAPKEISAFSPKLGISKVNYNGKSKIKIVIRDANDLDLQQNQNVKNLDAKQYKDIYDYLRGQVPGVHIGPSNAISIRGFMGNPLFVLNGGAVDQDVITSLVPTNIKSVRVLKGPEAAIYGLRGSKGIIEFTTF